jgi:quercetin dioxygenase-like cupin family protein
MAPIVIRESHISPKAGLQGARIMRSYLCVTVAAVIATVVATALVRSNPPLGGHGGGAAIELFSADQIEWHEGPPSLPSGAMIAVLEGDPAKEGPFVFRLKIPDGYRVAPHTHPKTERVTVMSGTFNIGMGDTFDEKATKEMTAGAYGFWPAGMTHFVWAKGETILQFHGMGPWSIRYVNPLDDPRNARK